MPFVHTLQYAMCYISLSTNNEWLQHSIDSQHTVGALNMRHSIIIIFPRWRTNRKLPTNVCLIWCNTKMWQNIQVWKSNHEHWNHPVRTKKLAMAVRITTVDVPLLLIRWTPTAEPAQNQHSMYLCNPALQCITLLAWSSYFGFDHSAHFQE